MPAIMDAAQPAGKAVNGAVDENGRFSPTILDFGHVEERVEKSLLKKVQKLVEEFPERALEVIRGWMAEGA